MNRLKTILLLLASLSFGPANIWADLRLFKVDLEFMLLDGGQLSATITNDLQLQFTEEVAADFVLVLENAFTSPPTGGYSVETTPFSYQRNGDEVLPSADTIAMGYLAEAAEAIQPENFFFEIGTVNFSAGDFFTITGSAQSKEEWTGDVPVLRSQYNAFLADSNGLPIGNVEVIPEYSMASLFFGIGTLLFACFQCRRSIKSSEF